MKPKCVMKLFFFDLILFHNPYFHFDKRLWLSPPNKCKNCCWQIIAAAPAFIFYLSVALTTLSLLNVAIWTRISCTCCSFPLIAWCFPQCHVIGFGLHISVHFYSMFTSCSEQLESHLCSHCHWQAPSGVDDIKWTDLVSLWVYWCLLAELKSAAVWDTTKLILFG